MLSWFFALFGWGGVIAIAVILFFGFKAAEKWLPLIFCAAALGIALWGWNGYRNAAANKAQYDKEVLAHKATRGERDKARTERDDAKAALKECSDSVDNLGTVAEKRAGENKGERQEAQRKAQQHREKASRIMSKPPAVPEDDAESARAFVKEWLAERNKQ